MDIEELKAFLAVAEAGSFSRAAERIHLTQPAISRRVARLEQSLDARLFDRIGTRIQLTEAGGLLRERAAGLLLELADIRRAIQGLSGEVSGGTTFATSHHCGLHRLPPVLERFHQRYPGVRLDLRFLDSEEACRRVARGELEFAVVTLPPRVEAPLRALPIWPDPIDIMVSTAHPLAGASGPLTLHELLAWPALLPEADTYTRELVLREFGELRAQVAIEISSNYMEVLKMLCRAGLGWSALPRIMRDERLATLQVGGLRLRRELGVVLHTGRSLSNAGRALVEMLQEPAPS